MKIENTDAQVKAQLIQAIQVYKDEAINLGFDYPTQPIEEADSADLILLYTDIIDFIAYNAGYSAAIHGEELETITTH